LCDDSTDPIFRQEVDAFHDESPERTVVLRRTTSHGFKAGNLNHALKQIARDYPFFVVNDADGIMPPTFISRLLVDFDDESIGFVQSPQVAIPSRTAFGRCLGVGVGVYWTMVAPYSASFGFLIFHGHGAMVRTAAWQRIGGFPEIVSEDLAFSTEARRFGYIGRLSETVACAEEVPECFKAFMKRQLKYCTGSCEHLLRFMTPFLTSRAVRWYEKCDRLLASLMMLSPLLFLVAIGASFARQIQFSGVPVGPSGASVGPGPRLILWSLLAGWLGPLLPACLHMRNTPARLFRYIAACFFAHLVMAPTLAIGVLKTIVTGRTTFPVTGDRGNTALHQV
jgi:cellulose synthase/poly-beta-1,6-N-acetylglucosamine synthase-like glycosyltransferase